MKLDYRVFVHLESLSVIPKTGRRREAVISFLDYLEANYHLGSAISYIDQPSSRTYFVSTVCGFRITWWVDSPVMEVKVVKIEEGQ